MSARGVCEFCSRPVQSFETAAFRIRGWEAERGSSGGANAIIGRERQPDRIAHAVCVRNAADMARRGIAPGQAGLF